jgi:hypothetical protein
LPRRSGFDSAQSDEQRESRHAGDWALLLAPAMIRALKRLTTLWRSTWQDAAALAALLTAAVLLDPGLIGTGDCLPLSYGDWIGHAYRVLFFKEHGLATWDHNWAGGISLFQKYQFVPHAVTAVVSGLFDAPVGRTMLLLQGLLLIWVRISGYVTARAARVPPVPALSQLHA